MQDAGPMKIIFIASFSKRLFRFFVCYDFRGYSKCNLQSLSGNHQPCTVTRTPSEVTISYANVEEGTLLA